MTEQQYKKASKVVFCNIVIIFGYVAVTMIAWYFSNKDASTWKTFVQMFTAILVIIISAVSHFTLSGTKRGALIMEISMAIGYVVLSLLNTTSGTYAYALPLLVATLAYLDLRFTVIGNIIVIASNVVRLIIHYDPNNQQLLASNVLAIFVLCLVAYTSIRVTKLLLTFNKENLQQLETAAKMQGDSNHKMQAVAEDVMKNFDSAMDMLNHLGNSIDVSHSSMKDIAESTESTAEAIQQQTIMCSDIQ